jgi:protein-S-isoprenylcysteine O-methyltransferase Ste14
VNTGTKAFRGFLIQLLVSSAAIFLSAWTLWYWQAWVFLAVFFTSNAGITVYLAKCDQQLFERRVNVRPQSQKIVIASKLLAYLLVIVIPALDHRWSGSNMAPYISIIGDAIVALGYFMISRVFRENAFAVANVEISAGQKVISTGPYARVRHPMYSWVIVILLAVPFALGSWWGLLAVIPSTIVVITRLFDEEKFLARNLPGYTEYCAKVRWRLLPGIF